MEIDGKEYTLHRELRRLKDKNGNSRIELKTSSIHTSEGKVLYSTTEMKAKVLKLLNFREPKGARASSAVYRYSVYTPQEEMKRIILEDRPEDRLNTMRKIFNLEKYSTAKNNAQTVMRSLKMMRTLQEEKLKEEEGTVRKKKEDEENLKSYDAAVKEGEKRKNELQGVIDATEKEYSDAKDRYDVLNRKDTELKNHQKMLRGLIERKDEKDRSIRQMEANAGELKKKADAIAVPEIKEKEEDMENEINKINREIQAVKENKGGIKKDIENYEGLIAEGICPVCRREVHSEEFRPKLEDLSLKLKEADKRLEYLEKEIQKLTQVRKEIQAAEKLKRDREEYANRAKREEEHITEARKELEKMVKSIEEENEIIGKLSGAGEGLETARKTLAEIEKKKTDLNSQMKAVIEKLSDARARFDETKRRLEEYDRKIEEFRKAREKVARYSNLISFIEDVFIPAMDDTEQSVMATLNVEMREQVSTWFRNLVPDPQKEITIDDKFTPIIRQSGYDLDVSALSGGEKSAVALSYRLSLNTLVNEFLGNVGLLILDEPTDGTRKRGGRGRED